MYIRPFDPWKNPLCTCPVKYGLNPYTGCAHSCTYCYISSYIKNAFTPRPKEGLVRHVIRDLKSVPPGSIISLSNSSDPYTPPEARLGLTRRVLGILVERGYRIQITTKSPLVVRDLDIIRRGRAVVQMTVTTLRPLYRKLEPGAPPPEARLKALRTIANSGVPIGVRIDPVIPHVNSDPRLVEEVVRAAADIGADHVVASTYKAKPDNFKRLLTSFPEHSRELKRIYWEEGEYFHGQRYAPRHLRRELLASVREAAKRYGLRFVTCREGLEELDDASAKCDGSHLL